LLVRRHRLPRIGSGMQRDRGPEALHARKVMIPAVLDHPVEDRTEDSVCAHAGVELVDEHRDVFLIDANGVRAPPDLGAPFVGGDDRTVHQAASLRSNWRSFGFTLRSASV